jgi:hypothetical protein
MRHGCSSGSVPCNRNGLEQVQRRRRRPCMPAQQQRKIDTVSTKPPAITAKIVRGRVFVGSVSMRPASTVVASSATFPARALRAAQRQGTGSARAHLRHQQREAPSDAGDLAGIAAHCSRDPTPFIVSAEHYHRQAHFYAARARAPRMSHTPGEKRARTRPRM